MASPREGIQNVTGDRRAEKPVCLSQKLQDDLQALGLKVKQHEDNIEFLKGEMNRSDDLILGMNVALGRYHKQNVAMQANEDGTYVQTENEVVEHVLSHMKSAAATFHQLRASQGSHDVLGTVATLGRVDDDSLSRLLAEFLGKETMIALVCKTMDGLKKMESYDTDGWTNPRSDIHAIGEQFGRSLHRRYLVICLEHVRPFTGDFIPDDPQRRLDIRKPKLPDGETPSGFIGFAVNMIILDNSKLCCVTSNRHGLRETLFYHLFSTLQIYKTKDDILKALPFISNGAISLDGGIIKRGGIFTLGIRSNVDVKFPKSARSLKYPQNYYEVENQIKETNWRKERMIDDMRREHELLDMTKRLFDAKKEEFVKSFLAESSTMVSMNHI